MNASEFHCRALGICAAALLAGCGGGAPASPSGPGAVGSLPQSRATVRRPDRGRSWMDASAKSGDLLYVSDTETGDLYVFSYPKGTPKGTLTGLVDPAGECVDAVGNVFVTNTGASNVVEYAHGGTTPIATLKDPGYFPVGCSVDPTTGNLAVTNFSTTGSTQGDVVIYKHARGRPTGHFTDPNTNQMLLCGYDDKGNLFVDGLTQGYAFSLVELRVGSTTLTPIAVNQSIGNAGAVQWDGQHLAIGDQTTNTIYRFDIIGKKGKMVGSTALAGAVEVFQFWIQGGKVIGPDAGAAAVGVWKYPGGGTATKTFTGVYVPLGATVSKGL
jgi:hypothetical protein